jgi:hypothetical protein
MYPDKTQRKNFFFLMHSHRYVCPNIVYKFFSGQKLKGGGGGMLYPDDIASLVLERSICDSLYDD